MKKEEIIRYVKEHATGTILSFPDRGPWGSSKYRGNFSGWIPASILVRFLPEEEQPQTCVKILGFHTAVLTLTQIQFAQISVPWISWIMDGSFRTDFMRQIYRCYIHLIQVLMISIIPMECGGMIKDLRMQISRKCRGIRACMQLTRQSCEDTLLCRKAPTKLL